MLGILKVYIKNSIFYSQIFSEKEIKEIEKEFQDEITIENINFDNLTFEDFCDYMNFIDYDKLLIVCNIHDNRFNGMIVELKEHTNIKIIVSSPDRNIFSDYNFSFKDAYDYTERLESSEFAINTGFYPFKETIHIKHIIIDKLESYLKIDKTIRLNTSINSLLIYTSEISSDFIMNNNSFRPIIISKKEFKNTVEYKKFDSFNLYNSSKYIEDYHKNGITPNKKGFLLDCGRYRNKKNLYALFIENEKIYYDFQKYMLIASNLETNIYEIINNVKQLKDSPNYSDSLITEFFISNSIASNQKGNIRFVSPFTSYKYPYLNAIQNTRYESWLGFINSEGYFLFNKKKNKLFKVNEDFMEIFELLLKGLQHQYSNPKSIKKVEDILQNV